MNKIKGFLKRFGTDIAGYTCLVLVIPIGWLPGPGGIPLLITGLTLLSIHNQWARTLLDHAKRHSTSLRKFVFPEKKNVELAWDIVAICSFIASFVISIWADILIIRIACTALAAASTTALLFNRSRLERVQNSFKKKR